MYRIEPMVDGDVTEVSRVERRCFSNPWPSAAYRRELADRQHNVYLVLRDYRADASDEGAGPSPEPPRRVPGLGPLRQLVRHFDGDGRIIGFAGMWHMFEEAHVTTIGVDPSHRGHGLGELLLVSLIDQALRRKASWMTLEVRVSNEPAQALYRKYGFTVQGTRKRYYSDNNEDAYIMWSPQLTEQATLDLVAGNRKAILARHPQPGVENAADLADDRSNHQSADLASEAPTEVSARDSSVPLTVQERP